jgi:hypothetical protein
LVGDPTFKRFEEVEFREYGPNDRTATMNIEHFGEQTVYLDGGSTIDIMDRRISAKVKHLICKCSPFGVNTAGGVVSCNSYIPLKVYVDKSVKIIRWYLLEEGVYLPHKWILSRGSLEKLGWTDIMVRLDSLNDDTEFTNHKHINIGYEGYDGPWLDKSYPLNSNNSSAKECNNNEKRYVDPPLLKKGNHYKTKLDKRYVNKEQFGPHYDPRFDGLVNRQRVKVGETEIRGQFYELYMKCLMTGEYANPQFFNEFQENHKDFAQFVEEQQTFDANVLLTEEDDEIEPEDGYFHEMF